MLNNLFNRPNRNNADIADNSNVGENVVDDDDDDEYEDVDDAWNNNT